MAGDLGDTPDALVAELLAGASAAQLETVEDATLLGSARAPRRDLAFDASCFSASLLKLASRSAAVLAWQGRSLGAVTGQLWRVHAVALGVPDGPAPAGGWRAAYAEAAAREAARAEALRERLRTTYAAHETLKQTKRIQARQAGGFKALLCMQCSPAYVFNAGV